MQLFVPIISRLRDDRTYRRSFLHSFRLCRHSYRFCRCCRGGLGRFFLQRRDGILNGFCHRIHFRLLGDILAAHYCVYSFFPLGKVFVLILVQSFGLSNGCLYFAIIRIQIAQFQLLGVGCPIRSNRNFFIDSFTVIRRNGNGVYTGFQFCVFLYRFSVHRDNNIRHISRCHNKGDHVFRRRQHRRTRRIILILATACCKFVIKILAAHSFIGSGFTGFYALTTGSNLVAFCIVVVLKSRCLFRRTSNCTQATIRGAGRILAHIHFTGKVAMLDCCTASAAACRTYNTAKILRSLAVGRQFSCCIAVDDLCITRQLTSNSAAMTGRQRQFTRIYAIANLAVTICKANNTTCIQAARVPREQQITCIPTVINHRIACLATQSYHTVHKIFVIGKRHICRAVKNCAAASKTGNRTVIRILPLGINVDRSLHSQAGNLSIFNIAKKTAENRCPIHIRKIQVAYGVAIAVEFAAEAVLYFTVRIHR